ncbi:hypothetical protein MKEN_00537200 [Mycena kentingensis (nom. inval.)]|nr:hypothetical protein MKEN_00537200 [Mycena kentingensis (nom. inval.)]
MHAKLFIQRFKLGDASVDGKGGILSSKPLPPLPSQLNETEHWIARAHGDALSPGSSARFLRRFETGSLGGDWDHYALVRAVYLLLTVRGRTIGRDAILHGIEMNDRKNGRAFNTTNAYFWIQLVHFAISSTSGPARAPPSLDWQMPSAAPSSSTTSLAYLESMLADLDSETAAILFDARSVSSTAPSDWSFIDATARSDQAPSESECALSQNSADTDVSASEAESESDDDTPGPGHTDALDLEFISFIRQNPFVANAELWRAYYTNERMMSPKSCARMALPDRKRLPNIVGRDIVGA